MGINFFSRKFRTKRVELSENQLISLSKGNIQIDCLHGAVWVTWPDGFERTIIEGQTITVSSKGKVCIQAFSKSIIRVNNHPAQREEWFDFVRLPKAENVKLTALKGGRSTLWKCLAAKSVPTKGGSLDGYTGKGTLAIT